MNLVSRWEFSGKRRLESASTRWMRMLGASEEVRSETSSMEGDHQELGRGGEEVAVSQRSPRRWHVASERRLGELSELFNQVRH